MHRANRSWMDAGTIVALVSSGLALSCTGPLPDTCEELGTCARADGGSFAPDGTAEGATDGSTCDLTKGPKDEPCVLDDAYGVFVASDGMGGAGNAGDGEAPSGSSDGSMSRPFATIGQALANLGSSTRIYVCNGLYSEQVTVTTAVSLYGGLSCAAGSTGPVWTYTGASAEVSSPSPTYALSVSGVSSGVVTIEDVSFASPGATVAGDSSLAALVASSSVNFVRVTLSAGGGANGAAGADGTANPNYTGPAPAGGAQVWTDTSGLFGALSGGAGGVNQCSQSGTSAAGDGGLGCAEGVGTAGTANPQAPVTMPGRDGLPMGVTVLGDGGTPVTVTANDPGADGLAGEGGVAAPSEVYGSLLPSGWTPSPGGDGATGNPGQGGAGATDPLYGQCSVATQSIGGGGGGAGGCGGAGGKGGGGGGASVALASIDSTVGLTGCVLISATAGIGGPGGAGEDGQAGARGGDYSSFSGLHAPGAAGGNGAGGSGGAGGTGGISVGVLSKSSTIATDPSTDANIRLGAPGAGGAAGPVGRYSAGILTTGVDGNPGVPGSAGTSVGRIDLM